MLIPPALVLALLLGSGGQTSSPSSEQKLVFRELLVGVLPSPSFRNTWTLILGPAKAQLRLETQRSRSPFLQLDRTTHAESAWLRATRTDFAGEVLTRSPLVVTLSRTAGEDGAAALRLECAAGELDVHPAFATLVPGWKNDDDSSEPPSWAPARTTKVRASACRLVTPAGSPRMMLSFTELLAFSAGAKGLEWGFVNSGGVLQQGGYRFLP